MFLTYLNNYSLSTETLLSLCVWNNTTLLVQLRQVCVHHIYAYIVYAPTVLLDSANINTRTATITRTEC